jgi:membrane-associated phospholipid phosphatase
MKRTIAILLLIVVFIYPLGLQAAGALDQEENEAQQTASGEEETREKKDSLIKNWASDHGRIWTSPTRIKGTQWLIWGGVILATGVMIANDEAIYRSIKDFQEENGWVDDASPVFSKLAEGYPIPIAGLFLLSGWLIKDRKLVETGSMALQAIAHSFVVVQTVKHLTGRQRPSWEDGKDKWWGPSGAFKRYSDGRWAKYDAFFSGHTVTIWSLATVIAHQYSRSVWIPILCYSVATLSGMATITEDLHWISDVFLGMVVGYAIGRFVVKRRSTTRWQVQPVVRENGIGIGVSYVF